MCGKNSNFTTGLDTTFYFILIFYLFYNFGTILMILYVYGMALICIQMLPFMSDKLYSTLYMYSAV
jgi:hypothetical protein